MSFADNLRSAIPDLAADDHVARVAISEDGRIVYANDAFYDLAGQGKSKRKATNAKDIIHFSKGQDFSAMESGTQIVTLNGHAEPVHFHFDWLTLGKSQKILIGSEVNENEADMAAHQIAEQAGAPSVETRTQNDGDLDPAKDFENFLDMNHDALLVMDDTGRILRSNQAFRDIFGAVEYVDLQDRFTDRHGFERWMTWRTQVRGGLIYVVGEDVSAARTHELELMKRASQLREAEGIAGMGHWRWQIGQDNLSWSEQIFNIFGLSHQDFTPSIDNIMKMIHRRDVGRVIQAFQRAMIEEQNYDMEFRITRPDGELRYIHCEGRCERDDEGDVVALFGIMQDMTERELYEKNLRDAKDAAERAYNAKSQFLANMSHELRTPLNAIIGFSEMMQRQLLGPIGTEKYLDYISGIRESGEHLLDLISDILDMSKIEAGKYELDLEEININKVIELAVHMMEGRALDDNIKIRTSIPKDLSRNIIADRRAVMQILLNLMSNAVKFSNEGGEVVVCYAEDGDSIILSVADNGIGIPANKLNSIVRPFEQVSMSYTRDHEGSGLGLAITKELAELHGGSLDISSKVGVGTKVCIKLPFDARSACHKR